MGRPPIPINHALRGEVRYLATRQNYIADCLIARNQRYGKHDTPLSTSDTPIPFTRFRGAFVRHLRAAFRGNSDERLPHRLVVRGIGEVDARQVKRRDGDVVAVKDG